MINWLYQLIDSPYESIIVPVSIVVAFLLFSKIFTKYLSKLLLYLTKKTQTDLDDRLVEAFNKPLSFFFAILGLYIAIQSLPFDMSNYGFIDKMYRSIVIITISFGFFNLATGYVKTAEETSQKYKVNKMMVVYLSKVSKFFILIIGIFMISKEWGYDLNGLLAGLGITGIAFAFAARETFSNIFSGVVIIIEKPFEIGDWISVGSIEGIVEDISFRSTKVRTFSKSLMIVPNSKLTNDSLVNWSNMGQRKVNFSLGLKTNTEEERLSSCIEKIKETLINYPDINSESVVVYFEKVSASSLDVSIEFFTDKIAKKEYLKVKEDVNFKVIRLLKEEKVEIQNLCGSTGENQTEDNKK